MRIFLSSIFLMASLAVAYGNGFDQNYVRKIIENGNLVNEQLLAMERTESRLQAFVCSPTGPSPSKPTSVHALRPADIDVVGAIGDSLTAANGAKAATVIGLMDEARGVSWSMGGEESASTLPTLPNILRRYNPNLKGFSTATSKVNTTQAGLNIAYPGDTSHEMFDQARNLVSRMRTWPGVDFNNDWKMVTFFIGGNDLCKYCKDKIRYNSDNYVKNIQNTLDFLHQNLPRTFVNMVLSLNVLGIDILSGITCRNMQKAFCDCALDPNNVNELNRYVSEYHTKTEALINSGRYDTRNDFTVVLQPFMKSMTPPLTSSGKADFSFFAPDCFHFSKKGHIAAGIELWNNIVTRVGQKSVKWDSLLADTKCPAANEFLYTRLNSN